MYLRGPTNFVGRVRSGAVHSEELDYTWTVRRWPVKNDMTHCRSLLLLRWGQRCAQGAAVLPSRGPFGMPSCAQWSHEGAARSVCSGHGAWLLNFGFHAVVMGDPRSVTSDANC